MDFRRSSQQPFVFNHGFSSNFVWSRMNQISFVFSQEIGYFKCGFLTLSLLRYLKTRIHWGGAIYPPSKSHVWCPNMPNDHWKALRLLLESANKFANLQKLNFFVAKSSFIVKMFAQKKWQKMIKYTFFKSPGTMP